MKTAEINTVSSAAQNQIQAKRQPFFAKEGQNSFFSKSSESTPSFFSPTTIQPKLTIGQPNDKYEVEADAMADKVVQRLSESSNQSAPLSIASPSIQRKCSHCDEEEKLQKKENRITQKGLDVQRKPIFESNAEKPDADIQSKPLTTPVVQAKCDSCEQVEKLQKKEEEFSENEMSLQRKAANLPAENSDDLESRLSSSKGSGSSLPSNIQSSMSSEFGADFSNVRVHTASDAVQMSQGIGALAFTHGSDIYFNQGKYDTNSTSGKHLLAHELTHTIQQQPQSSISQNSIQRTPETFSGCRKTQRIMISNHLVHARRWVDGARAKLELLFPGRMPRNGIIKIANAYASNFGIVTTNTDIMQNLGTIYTNLGIILTGLARSIEYICTHQNNGFMAETARPLPNPEDFPALRVNGIKIHDIWFQCDYYTRVSTLIHEVAHTDLNIRGDIYEYDHGYGNFGWIFSRQNPDSYAVFARQLYHFNNDTMAPGLTCNVGDIMEGHGENAIQPKLTIGQPNDKYEVEADAMADKVVQRLSKPSNESPSLGTANPSIQHKCFSCKEENKLQKKEDDISRDGFGVQPKPIFEINAEQPEADMQSKFLAGPIIQTKFSNCDQEDGQVQKMEIDNSASSVMDITIQKQEELPLVEPAGSDCALYENNIQAAINIAATWVTGARSWFSEYRNLLRGRAQVANPESAIGAQLFQRFQLLDAHFNISNNLRSVPIPSSRHQRYNAQGFVALELASHGVYDKFNRIRVRDETYHCVNNFCPTGRRGTEVYGRVLTAGSNEYNLYTQCWNPLQDQTRAGVVLHECFHSSFSNFNHDTYSFESRYPGRDALTNAESYATFAGIVSMGSDYRIIELEAEVITTPTSTTTPETVEPVHKKSINSGERNNSSSHQNTSIENRLLNLKGKGRPLSDDVKQSMEYGFETNFSDVRIHTGPKAIQLSESLGAQAFTSGNDIYFNKGKYNVNSQSGKHLLAHELTHTIQQNPKDQQSVQKSSLVQNTQFQIQKRPTYAAPRTRRDIDPLDPNTAPTGVPDAFGISYLHVNGREIKSYQELHGTEGLKNLLFPLPEYEYSWGDCDAINKDLTVNSRTLMRILTLSPWQRTMPKADLGQIRRGGFIRNMRCGDSGDTTVIMHGNPSDMALQVAVRDAEKQHETDFRCLFDRHIMAYQNAVNALPNSLSRGPGGCNLSLDLRLRRQRRTNNFLAEFIRFSNDYDRGSARTHFSVRVASQANADCSVTEATYRHNPLTPQTRICTPWTP